MSLFRELRGNLRLTVSFISGLLFFSCHYWSSHFLARRYRVARGRCWAALGWAAGILLAPYKREEKRLRRISKGIAGFLSGYSVG